MNEVTLIGSQPGKVPFFVPFGARGVKALITLCKKENISAEKALLQVVLDLLKNSKYTGEDIERVLERDNIHEQVAYWVDKNRKMLSLGRGGVYATLRFSISQRDITEDFV